MPDTVVVMQKKRLRKEEIQSLSGPNELAEFYERLRHLKDFHRRYPGEVTSYQSDIVHIMN